MKYMDETIFTTKNKTITLYFSTYQVGLGLSVVARHKSIYLMIGTFELEIKYGKERGK